MTAPVVFCIWSMVAPFGPMIARAMSEVPLAPSEHAVALASLNMLLRGHALARAWQ